MRYLNLLAALLFPAFLSAKPSDKPSIAPTLRPTLSLSTQAVGDALSEIEASNEPGNPLRIHSGNSQQFRSLIIPELYLMVRTGALELNVAPQLKFKWNMVDAWGGSSKLLQRVDGESKPIKEAILRTQAPWWNQKILSANFRLSWAKDQKREGRLDGRFWRAYVNVLSSEGKLDQYFREKVVINEPSALSQMGYVTFRVFGEDEDFFWFFSPALKKLRQLTGSNRADSILSSGVGLDDFLVWSGKLEHVDSSAIQNIKTLAPFVGVDRTLAKPLDKQAVCLTVGSDEDLEGAEDIRSPNFSQMFPLGGLLSLPEATFVPRDVARIELMPTDPFSIYARQVLYVDIESGLPIYKIVFDRTGRLWKIVLGVLGGAQSSEGREFPYYSKVISIDRVNQSVSALEFISFGVCSDFSSEVQLADFDPKRLG